MPLNELWLVRHGESVANVAATAAELAGRDRIDIRDADVPLSPTGREQAQALGSWLDRRREAIDVCWVSPYVRAGDSGDRTRELGILDLTVDLPHFAA